LLLLAFTLGTGVGIALLLATGMSFAISALSGVKFTDNDLYDRAFLIGVVVIPLAANWAASSLPEFLQGIFGRDSQS
jgi:hypothetical protein